MPFTVVRSTPPTVIPRAPTSRTPVAPFPLIVDDWTTVLVSDPAASRPKKPLSTITSPAACPPVTESREPGRPPADYGRPGRLRQYRWNCRRLRSPAGIGSRLSIHRRLGRPPAALGDRACCRPWRATGLGFPLLWPPASGPPPPNPRQFFVTRQAPSHRLPRVAGGAGVESGEHLPAATGCVWGNVHPTHHLPRCLHRPIPSSKMTRAYPGSHITAHRLVGGGERFFGSEAPGYRGGHTRRHRHSDDGRFIGLQSRGCQPRGLECPRLSELRGCVW